MDRYSKVHGCENSKIWIMMMMMTCVQVMQGTMENLEREETEYDDAMSDKKVYLNLSLR